MLLVRNSNNLSISLLWQSSCHKIYFNILSIIPYVFKLLQIHYNKIGIPTSLAIYNIIYYLCNQI